MAQVITFQRYRPIPRYDDTPWTEARIEEAADPDGPWTALNTVALDPVDSDPANPASRNLTTEIADDAPDLWYRIIFIDGTGDEALPTDPVQNTDAATNLYVSAAELKTILGLENETFADTAIDFAVRTASRVCDAYKKKTGVGFYPTAATRTYSPGPYDDTISIDDVISVSSVTVDRAGDGSYDETWVENTDFYLDPENAAANGRPYNQLTLTRTAARRFPDTDRALKVTGVFGWSETPDEVKQAAILIANNLLFRTREAPMGVLVAAAAEAVAMARLGKLDSAAALLLDMVDPNPAHGSLQLG